LAHVLDLLDLWLAHVLDLLDLWLAHVLDLLDLLLRLMNNLSGNSLIVNSFVHFFNWDIFDLSLIGGLRDIFNDMLNLIVVSDNFFDWNVFGDSLLDIFDNGLLVWDLFIGRFTSDG
jgi:hypothetical protein